MKIKSKIALRYAIVTALLMAVFAIIIYCVSLHDRQTEFYDDLNREGFSRANLYFEAEATPEIMHSIYKNNIQFIDEVEVAIYDTNYNLLYHDAKEIDIVKETPELLDNIKNSPKDTRFEVEKYQAVGFKFNHSDNTYLVTAAAYDGYGYNKLNRLVINLIILSLISILLSFYIGYFLAKRALKPVSKISGKMKEITANNLGLRLAGYNEKDEFGEMAASFNKALDIIETSFNSQKQFVSNVSHELRTPLATLIGEIDLALLKERNVQEYIATLETSKQDVRRLIILVNGLLDLAKASYDESNISFTDVRIDEILLDARETVIKANPDYKIELQFNYETDDDINMIISGNEYLLKIAFINLMENNCKFSSDHTSIVHIIPYKDKITIQFEDKGIGISPEEIQHIFTPFYRGNNKDYAFGNGIGMTLVKKVITLHKGKIDVRSVPGEGTVFEVGLYKPGNSNPYRK